MKAARVQGAGAVSARISRRFGFLGEKSANSDDTGRINDVAEAGVDAAMRGLLRRCCCGASSADTMTSSSASQSAVHELTAIFAGWVESVRMCRGLRELVMPRQKSLLWVESVFMVLTEAHWCSVIGANLQAGVEESNFQRGSGSSCAAVGHGRNMNQKQGIVVVSGAVAACRV